MQCDDLFFGLVAIYAVPSAETEGWYQYPWNVPYHPELTSITPAQMGFASWQSLMAAVKAKALLLTNVPDEGDGGARITAFAEEKMSLQSKHKRSVAGISWTNTIKATAIQPDIATSQALAALVTAPHDLYCVGDGGQIFVVRAVAEAYECAVTKKASESSLNQEVQFSLVNCHGVQEVVLD